MFSISVKGTEDHLLLDADSFKLIKDEKYVKFSKGEKTVGLFIMENIRSIVQVNSFDVIVRKGV